ncbi:unnamed protein product [Caenorhabditis bovis]|uniref:Major sperm protein n=1 Tax=Caenorhabditis bovis TaxID=2654633 RepID=A0A8S1EQN5_9PELO|nr:unnamed protein product [Caenorhabditis bovis]
MASAAADEGILATVELELNEKRKRISGTHLRIFPMEYTITSDQKAVFEVFEMSNRISEILFEHTVANDSDFKVACRLMGSSSQQLSVKKSMFILEPGASTIIEVIPADHLGSTRVVQITRKPGAIQSHKIIIEATCIDDDKDLQHVFRYEEFAKKYYIRYHRPPTWHKTWLRMSSDVDIAEFPRILQLCNDIGLKASATTELSMNEFAILEVALSNDIEVAKQ